MKNIIACIVIISFMLSGCNPVTVAAPPSVPEAVESNPTAEAPAEIVLTIVGTGTKSFTLDELMALPSVEGQAGLKSSTGKIFTPELYKGVLITDLLALAGGADSTMGVQVEAQDGYSMTFSYDQIDQGKFITYDPGTGDETNKGGDLRPILAYEMGGKPLNLDTDGGLRLVVISEKPNQVVDGHWSVKFVNKLTIKPLSEEWSLDLQGAINDIVDRGSFESCSTGKCHQASWTDDEAQTWKGTPLYLLVGRVDDENKHENSAFSVDLADQGYSIEIVAEDGYSVTLDSARVKNNKEIIVAYQVNDNPLIDTDFPLKLVGPALAKDENIGQIAKIIVHLDQKPEVVTKTEEPASVSLVISDPIEGAALSLTGLVAETKGLSIDDLKSMESVQATVEHPKKGKMDVSGITLKDILALVKINSDAKSIVFVARDGYLSELPLLDALQCSDCLVSFGDSDALNLMMPGMESNFWVKEIIQFDIH